jgi:hypothetical protein
VKFHSFCTIGYTSGTEPASLRNSKAPGIHEQNRNFLHDHAQFINWWRRAILPQKDAGIACTLDSWIDKNVEGGSKRESVHLLIFRPFPNKAEMSSKGYGYCVFNDVLRVEKMKVLDLYAHFDLRFGDGLYELVLLDNHSLVEVSIEIKSFFLTNIFH